MEWKIYSTNYEVKTKKIIDWLNNELDNNSAGRITPHILEFINVQAYNETMKINQLANISSPEARVLIIKVFDPSVIKTIATAINNAKIDANMQIDPDRIRLNFPVLTQEFRLSIIKKSKVKLEEAKIKVRKCRSEIHEEFKKDSELSDEDKKYFLSLLDKATKITNDDLDKTFEFKKAEILKI